MDAGEAVRGAQLLVADIERSSGLSAQVSTEYSADWREFHARSNRTPGAWVSLTVDDVGSAALDPTETDGGTAETFAMELARILQDDVQIHLRIPWPEDPAGGGRALEPTESGWRSRSDPSLVVPYGQLPG